MLAHAGVLARDHPAVAQRHRRGLLPGVHPGARGIRDPVASWGFGHADDRQGAVGGVLQQPRLARRLGRGGDSAADPHHPHRAVPAEPAESGGGRPMSRLSWFNVTSLTLGFAFLYLPMVILIVYSFNDSKLVTVWAGFSTRWYGELLQNESFLDAAWVTLKVAVFSSTIATVLGTMAAYVLVRGGRFMGRTLFSGMVYAPLVMPEVITGLSLLLLFIGIGLDRGVLTIVLAHTTFSMCFVSVVVSSRLVTFDRSLEEAALDLGCTPFTAFRLVTLPIIAPAVISGWLLAFTLSLDDLVIASFAAGPSATTLPIKIFSAVRLGVSPEINALSTIMIAIVTVGVISASLISKRATLRQEAEERAAMRG